MRRLAHVLLAGLAAAVILAGAPARAAGLSTAPKANPDGPAPQAKQEKPKPKTLAEERAELYARLAASKDADETEGIVGRLLRSYSESGSDTGDLLLQHARHAIAVEEYDDALKILDATIALLPDWAEGWNARATVRYLNDDYNGSMADIAQTRSTSARSRSRRTGATPRRRPTSSRPHWLARSFRPPVRRKSEARRGRVRRFAGLSP